MDGVNVIAVLQHGLRGIVRDQLVVTIAVDLTPQIVSGGDLSEHIQCRAELRDQFDARCGPIASARTYVL